MSGADWLKNLQNAGAHEDVNPPQPLGYSVDDLADAAVMLFDANGEALSEPQLAAITGLRDDTQEALRSLCVLADGITGLVLHDASQKGAGSGCMQSPADMVALLTVFSTVCSHVRAVRALVQAADLEAYARKVSAETSGGAQ